MSQTPITRRQLREKGSHAEWVQAAVGVEGIAERTIRKKTRDCQVTGSNSVTSTSSDSSSSSGGASSGVSSTVAKMRTRLSTGTLVMNGTSTIKEKDIRTPPSTPGSESPIPQKDAPATGSKRQATPAESSVIVPPKQRKTTKSDGTQNDPFCWLCHKDTCNVSCVLCPRSYHSKCLMLVSMPKDWVCAECEKMMESGCMDTRSRAMTQISTDTLCLLLRYALDRMRQPGSEVFQKPVNMAELPSYSDVIVNPMDFSMMEKNIKKKEYGCTEAFLSDAKWILHNCIIYNGLHHKLTGIARNVVKSCKHEMAEIEVCPQCYKHSCILGEEKWFIEPCKPPHPLVWAKLKGYPFWPAKAMVEVKGTVDVRFFGAHDKSMIPVSQVYMLSKDPPVVMKNKKGGFAGAMAELKEHIEVIRKRYSFFDYAPFHTPYDGRRVLMDDKLKDASTAAPKRFKIAAHGRFSVKGKETEKASAAWKTASAVKSKYSSMASKKSTPTVIPAPKPVGYPQHPGSSHPQVQSSSSPDTMEKAIRNAISNYTRMPTSKSRFLNPTVTMMDIIHQKIKQQQEMDRVEGDAGTGSQVTPADDSDDMKPGKEELSSKPRRDEVDVDKMEQDEVDVEKVEPDETAELGTTTKETTSDRCSDGRVAEGSAPAVDIAAEKGQETDRTATQLDKGHKHKTTGNVEETVDQENSKDVQAANERNALSAEGQEKLEIGRKTAQKKLEADSSLTSTSEKLCEQNFVTEGRQSQRDEGDKANLGTVTVQSATENKNAGTLSSDTAEIPASMEELANEAEAGNDTDLVQNSGSSLRTAIKVCASQEKESAGNTAVATTGQSSATPPPVTPSPKGSDQPASTTVSPQSGAEYRDSLMKTIEACKGKLGITHVEEVDDPMEVSEDEESVHSADNPERGVGAEAVAESQNSSDSQDSTVSLEMEVESMSCSTNEIHVKSSSDSLSEQNVESNLERVGVSYSSGQKPVCETFTEKQLEGEVGSDITSGMPEMQNDGSVVGLGKKKGSPDAAVSVMQKGAGSDQTSDTGSSKRAKPTSDSECYVTAAVPPKPLSHDKCSCVNNLPGDLGQGTSELVKVKHVSLISSQSPSGAVSTDSGAEEKIAKASAVLRKVAENFIELAEHKSGASVSPQTASGPSPTVVFLMRQDKSAPPKAAEVRHKGHMTKASGAAAFPPMVAHSDQGGPPSGASTSSPITVVDDDEPTLLMEVETEAEREEPVVIDLDEDDVDTNENEAVTPQMSNSSGFMKELTPSPAGLQSISNPESSVVKKTAQSQPTRLQKVLSECSPSLVSSRALSSAATTSEPCEMMISDVRSLSGTVHEWKDDGNKQASSPPKQQASEQSQQQPEQHLSANQLLHQTLTQQLSSQDPPPSVAESSQSPMVLNFRMPPTPPIEQSQGNSTISRSATALETSTAGGISSVNNSSSRPSEDQRSSDPCPSLTPAAVSLVNKYSQRIVGNMQLQLAEMSKELLASAAKERDSLIEERVEQEKEQMQWTLAEVQHNHKLKIAEMKACWEAEMSKAMENMVNKMTKEKEEAVAETKKKQWMAAEEGKKKKFYFLPRMDILLIMEVLQQNPYRNGSNVYGVITDQLRQREEFRDVEWRTVQDRVERLLESFRNEQLQNMQWSGTKEEYDERGRLLQDLSNLEKKWATRKRPATATAADVCKKAAKQHAVGRPMLRRLAAPLQPMVTLTAEEGPAVPTQQVPDLEVGRQEECAEGVSNDPHPLAAVNDDGQENLNEAEQDPNVWLPQARLIVKKSISPAARWSTTMDYMLYRLEKEEESKKTALEVQKEELKLKKEEIEVRKMEATNKRLRIEAQQKEQQRRTDMEEERRKEEREERKLMVDRQNEERKEMMDRQNKLMDAMLQLIEATKK